MWHTTHELSATQLHHPSINAYQHYTTAQIPHPHAGHHNGNMNKWNIAGQRSSYSLPHPGHTQSNMRWSKFDEKAHLKATQTQPARNLSTSTRNLSAAPPNASYMHDQRQIFGPGVGMPRQRPASMYDSPNSMPNINYHNHHLNGFIPLPSNQSSKKDVAKQQQQHASGKNANVGLRQSPGELVRFKNMFFFCVFIFCTFNESRLDFVLSQPRSIQFPESHENYYTRKWASKTNRVCSKPISWFRMQWIYQDLLARVLTALKNSTVND